MRKVSILLLPVLLLAFLGILLAAPTVAQDATMTPTAGATTVPPTAQPTAEATAEATADQNANVQGQPGVQQGTQRLTRVRFVHLAPNAPSFWVGVNGQSMGIQEIAYPSATGWVEIPGNNVSLTFNPIGAQAAAQGQQGNNQAAGNNQDSDQAAQGQQGNQQAAGNNQGSSQLGAAIGGIGPVRVAGSNGQWTTVVLMSSANGGVDVLTFNESFRRLAPNCSRVTVIDAMGGQSATLTIGGIANVGANLGSIANANQSASLSCAFAGTANAATTGADATANNAGTANTATVSGNFGTALTCRSLLGGGSRTCAFTFDVPAGSHNLDLAGGAGTTNLGNTFGSGAYYLIGVTGTAGSPSVFTTHWFENDLASLIAKSSGGQPNVQAQGGQQNDQALAGQPNDQAQAGQQGAQGSQGAAPTATTTPTTSPGG